VTRRSYTGDFVLADQELSARHRDQDQYPEMESRRAPDATHRRPVSSAARRGPCAALRGEVLVPARPSGRRALLPDSISRAPRAIPSQREIVFVLACDEGT
jgi:hypothetical protein